MCVCVCVRFRHPNKHQGLYYDGFNAERRVQQRIRRLFNYTMSKKVRYNVHGRAFQNTELLPFVDSMWTCEGIDFTKGPAYWLVSISALPFGVFGEMLGADHVPPKTGTFCGESCANKWRGMLFGMTNRAGWNGVDPNDNANLWTLWDEFAIQDADLFGWWNESAPVKVESNVNRDQDLNNDILASAYMKHGVSTLIAIATWTNGTNETVRLNLDWNAMGLDVTRAHVEAPAGLKSFNRNDSAVEFQVDEEGCVELVVPAYEGWLLVASMR